MVVMAVHIVHVVLLDVRLRAIIVVKQQIIFCDRCYLEKMHYPIIRAGRGLLAVTGIHLITNGNGLGALGVSEVASVVSEFAVIAPFVGNMMCVLLFWPTVAPMYGQYYDFHLRQRHLRELQYMTPAMVAVVLYWMFS